MATTAHVVPGGGIWSVKSDGRTISSHLTKEQALTAARAWLKSRGGGELLIHDLSGKIIAKDTVAPGNDPWGRG